MTVLHACLPLLQACLAAGIAAGICSALPGDFHPPPPPPLPAYATQQVIYHMAGIVAGETVPDCAICDRWIACTLKRDIEGGRYPHSGRWHGYRAPRPQHLAAVEAALSEQGCLSVPACAFLGNLNDYRGWASNLAQGVPSHVVGNAHGAIVCVPPAKELSAPSNKGRNSLITQGKGTPSSHRGKELPHQTGEGNSPIRQGNSPIRQGNSLIRQGKGTPSSTREQELPHQTGERNSLINTHHQTIVCIPPLGPATPSPAPSTATTASTQPRHPPSPAPARPHRAGHLP